jgi:hypothetical protein
VALTRAREAEWQPIDDGKSAAMEGLEGGDARDWRGGVESRDDCSEDRARVSAFCRGRREAEAPGLLQWPAMKAPVPLSEEGWISGRVKVHN